MFRQSDRLASYEHALLSQQHLRSMMQNNGTEWITVSVILQKQECNAILIVSINLI